MCRSAPLLPLAAVVLLASCGAEAGLETAWTVRADTLPNGTVRVVNTPPASGAEPTWILREELRIGTVDGAGPASFGQVKGLAVTRDGRIVVLDAQAQELRVFGPGGEHLATHGRKGAGPGELESAFGLMRDADDRLWVPDHGNARMSVFDVERGFLRSYQPMIFLRYGFVWDGTMAGDGRIFVPSITLAPERRPVLRVYDPDMNPLDSLPLPEPPATDPRDPPGAFYWEAPGGLPRGYVSVPFFAPPHQLVDPSGEVWSTQGGDPAYRIARWAPGGDTALVLETARPPVPVGAAERDSVIEAVREQLRERGAARQDWSKIPAVKPAVASMFLTEDGRLWVRTPAADTLRTYDVYDREGRYLGTAVTALKIVRWVHPVVRGDTVWAVVTDELDVPYVVRARLARVGS